MHASVLRLSYAASPAVDGTSHRTSTIVRRTNRRTFLRNAAGLGLFGAGLAVLASACGVLPPQARAKIPRLGYLSPGPREGRADVVNAFLEGLRDLGYVEGQTIAIEWRFTPAGSVNDAAVYAELAAELVRVPVDVIVSLSSTTASQATKDATNTIPIVVIASVPVETGLVASLARPGSNVTGPSNPVGVNAKHLELLRSVVPGLKRAAALVDGANPAVPPQWDEFRQAAETAGVQAQRIDLYSTSDLERAFDVVESGGAQALSVMAQAQLVPVRTRVAELGLQHRLPAITRGGGYAEAGLLMSYGENTSALVRRAAVYVDKILRGAKPADLPLEQPTVFDFVVNINTAQALGLTIRSDIAAQVTKWVE
jgi:putative ABC transport system substrate-binding protein